MLNRALLISCDGAAADEQFEGVWHFKTMKGGESDLPAVRTDARAARKKCPRHINATSTLESM